MFKGAVRPGSVAGKVMLEPHPCVRLDRRGLGHTSDIGKDAVAASAAADIAEQKRVEVMRVLGEAARRLPRRSVGRRSVRHGDTGRWNRPSYPRPSAKTPFAGQSVSRRHPPVGSGAIRACHPRKAFAREGSHCGCHLIDPFKHRRAIAESAADWRSAPTMSCGRRRPDQQNGRSRQGRD